MSRRRMLLEQGGLPAIYQRCEYLESDNNRPSIDSGFVSTVENVKIEIQFMQTSRTQLSTVFGNVLYADVFGVIGNGNPMKLWIGGSRALLSQSYNQNEITKVFVYAHNGIVEKTTNDGTTETANYSGTIINGISYGFFCRKQNATFSEFSSYLRIYRFKLWENDILVRDMIPCYLKTDETQLGFYDLVENNFHTNANNRGYFTKGPDIN